MRFFLSTFFKTTADTTSMFQQINFHSLSAVIYVKYAHDFLPSVFTLCACAFACRRSKKSKRKLSQKVLIGSNETTDSTEPQSGEGLKPKSTREWQVYSVFARWWCVQAAFVISVIWFNLIYGNVHFQRLFRGQPRPPRVMEDQRQSQAR